MIIIIGLASHNNLFPLSAMLRDRLLVRNYNEKITTCSLSLLCKYKMAMK